MSLLLIKIQRVATLSVIAAAVLFLLGANISFAGDTKQQKRNFNLTKTQNELNFNKLVSASEDLGGDGSWVVLETSGSVYFQAADQENWQPAVAKTVLTPGAKVRADDDSQAFLSHYKDKAVLTANSQLEIAQAKKTGWISVILDFGTSLFDVNRRSSNRFQVETKFLVATVKGTTFGVNVKKDEASVSVSEGTVRTENRNGSGGSDVTAGKTGRAGTAPGVLVSASTPGHSGVAPPGWSEKSERGKSSAILDRKALIEENKIARKNSRERADRGNRSNIVQKSNNGNNGNNGNNDDNGNNGNDDKEKDKDKDSCSDKDAEKGKCTQ